ncbi:MAG: hypothetical protein VYD09_04220, partial [Chloroflexota bacterium]|nr:hypothetical protein [Chloroflexota bacterium]
MFSSVGIIKLHESFKRAGGSTVQVTPSTKKNDLPTENNFNPHISFSGVRGETFPSTDINISTNEQLDSVWQVVLEDDDFHT